MRVKTAYGQLDVSILQDKVLGPVLGISDPRTDERIRFMGGNHRLKDLAALQMRQEELPLPCILHPWRS